MFTITGLFLLFLGLFLIIYLYFKHTYLYFEKRGIPYVEASFPFGNFKAFIQGKKSIGHVLQELYRSSPKVPALGFFQFNRPSLLIRDPDLIKQILIQDFGNFHDRSLRLNEKLNPLAGHLFFLRGNKWKNLRSKLSPVFTSGKIKGMFEIMKNNSENLVEYLKKNPSENIETKDLFARLLTDVIASCAFGIDCDSVKNPDAEFRQWGRKIFALTLKTNLAQLLSSTGEWTRKMIFWPVINNQVSDYFIEMVRETMKFREDNNIVKPDVMQMLIQLKNNQKIENKDDSYEKMEDSDGKSLSVEQCAAQAFVFFVAGFETSSSVMSFAVYELAKNPDMQSKVQKEIDEIFKTPQDITYENLKRMTYLDMIIKETLRKYPPGPVLDRIVTKPTNIKWNNERTILLEKGLKINISLLGLHHDPNYFPDPDQFIPERFSEINKQSINYYVYLPFGDGPRNCIGSRFGFLQTKLGLALLLHHFTFKTNERTIPEPEFNPRSFLLVMKGGIYLNIIKRQ